MIKLLRVSHPSKVLLRYLLWSQCSYTVCSMFVLHVRSKGHGCLLCTEIDKCQPHKPQHRKRRHRILCSEHLLHPLLLLSCLPTDTLLFIQQATTVTKTKSQTYSVKFYTVANQKLSHPPAGVRVPTSLLGFIENTKCTHTLH